MSQAIVNKLLHAPLVVLKQAASSKDEGDVTISVARKLFNLDKELKRPGNYEHRSVEVARKENPSRAQRRNAGKRNNVIWNASRSADETQEISAAFNRVS